jgi:hypothetical protein
LSCGPESPVFFFGAAIKWYRHLSGAKDVSSLSLNQSSYRAVDLRFEGRLLYQPAVMRT